MKTIEYDQIELPHSFVILDGAKTYIIAPEGLQVEQAVISGSIAPEVGNAMHLINVPLGTIVPTLNWPGKAEHWLEVPVDTGR